MRLFGHPLHPMLVHFPIAFWSLAAVSDGLAVSGLAGTWDYGWMLLALGLVAAVPAMIAGFVDLATLSASAERDGQRHMILMAAAWISFLAALLLRLESGVPSPSQHFISVLFSMIGMAFLAIGGWYGGQLVYRHGAGQLRPSDVAKTD